MAGRLVIDYPRNRFWRWLLRIVGRILMRLLTRTVITGRDHFPLEGPYILAGNHASVMEIVMMAVYAPRQVEFLGSGDLPIDPKFAWLADLYGFIPIMRGSVDREGINAAVHVLQRGGIIGIFPQGGIWDAHNRRTKVGAAMLSYLSQVVVVPIGFAGVHGALSQIMRLKRPELVMNIGLPVGPIQARDASVSLRKNLETGAKQILAEIFALLPEQERSRYDERIIEEFDLEVTYTNRRGETQADPFGLTEEERQGMGKFFYFPVLLDALARNLKLPVGVLQSASQFQDMAEIGKACQAILVYLQDNPGFFIFRLGIDQGRAVKQALQKITQKSLEEQHPGGRIRILPICQYVNSSSGEIRAKHGVESSHHY